MNIWKNNKKDNNKISVLHNDIEDNDHNEVIFLDCMLARKQSVSIFLLTGMRMQGDIIGADETSILICSPKNGIQMIYKHSIATICIDKNKINKE